MESVHSLTNDHSGISEKGLFLHELLRCTHRIYLWAYDTAFQPLYSNYPGSVYNLDLFSLASFSVPIREELDRGSSYPLILETDLGLLWIIAFEYHDLKAEKIYVLGPAFTGRNTSLLLRKKLDNYHLDVREYNQILRELEEVPIIPSNQLIQYAVMLHCAVTGAHITPDQVASSSLSGETGTSSDSPSQDGPSGIESITREHRGVWESEQRFLAMIREGNPEYIKALQTSNTLSSGVRAEVGDPLRQNKNNLLVLLTLVSRAAIEGGLSPSIAYTLNDDYAQRIELAENLAQAMRISRELIDDYVFRVRAVREQRGISTPIREACHTIQLHLTEKIRLSDLAARAGYADYYFSEKFRKEMGVSVGAYIQEQKLTLARNLLLDTNLTIQDISDRLAFSSRNNFTTAFRRHFGITPGQLREGKAIQS